MRAPAAADWFHPAKAPPPDVAPTAAGGTPRSGACRRYAENPLAMAALALLVLIVLATWLCPHLVPYRYDQMDLGAVDLPPGPRHWFGTDQLGRDLFVRTWTAGRVSLFIGLAAAAIDFGIGAVYGGISGYLGGAVDAVMMRVVDVLYGIPFLLVVILLLVAVGPGLRSVVLAIALVNWLGMARLVRGQVLQLKSREYVLAARGLGVPAGRVLTRHLLPGALGPMLVWVSYNVPQAIFVEALLSYIGLGIQPPLASWGSMVSLGTEVFRVHPWEFLFPAIALSVTMLSFYLVSDGLSAAMAPRGGRAWWRVRAVRPRAPVPDPAAPLLAVTDLEVTFRTPVVRGVSFAVAPGETVAIVGESGGGKSVTTLALLGLTPPGARVAGSVRWEGTEFLAAPEARWRRLRGSRVGAVFQDPHAALDPTMCVGRQVAEVAETHLGLGRRAAWAHAVDWLGRVGIADAVRRAGEYPHQFSGGMRQRVLLAIALAAGPRLLIADEPTAALDTLTAGLICELIADLQAELGMAVLLVSHDLGVVARSARRVLVMYSGGIVESGSVDAVFHRPAHPYTAGLLRALPGPDGRPPVPMRGAPPDPAAPASPGCAFAPRCPHTMRGCLLEAPGALPVAAAPAHTARCWLHHPAAPGVGSDAGDAP